MWPKYLLTVGNISTELDDNLQLINQQLRIRNQTNGLAKNNIKLQDGQFKHLSTQQNSFMLLSFWHSWINIITSKILLAYNIIFYFVNHLISTFIFYKLKTRMQKSNEPYFSPFRQKIFDLMKQQQTSKILKLSRKFQNKMNESQQRQKQFSMDTDIDNISKIRGLESSEGVNNFKSLEEKLELKNNSKSKSKQRHDNSISSQKVRIKKMSNSKKVSFIQNSNKSYFKSNKSLSMQKRSKSNKTKNYKSKNQSFTKTNSHKNSLDKSRTKCIDSQRQNKSYKNIKVRQNPNQSNNKKPFSSALNYESNQKQTQKKNYLLQTLKKMETVRKNLSKTFQQFDNFNNQTQRSKDQFCKEFKDQFCKEFKDQFCKKSKQKSKSNLTVISDYVNQESQSKTKYNIKKSKSKQSKPKSKAKIQNQKSAQIHQTMPSENFHRKTPTKNKYLNSHQSIEGKISDKKSASKGYLDRHLLKQLLISCKNPQKWQTILQNDLISIHFRIVKRRLIEIQIHSQQCLTNLQIQLHKANLICQSIKQDYENVKKKEIITLLCSVRGIQLQNQELNLFQFPKLIIRISTKMDQSAISFNKQIQIPYSWLMLVQRKKSQKLQLSSKKKSGMQQIKSRIKTRSIIQNIQLPKQTKYPSLLQIFSFIYEQKQSFNQNSSKKPTANKKLNMSSNSKNIQQNSHISVFGKQKSFNFPFELQEQQFRLSVKLNFGQGSSENQNRRKYDIQLQSKGEALMTKMLIFLQMLG